MYNVLSPYFIQRLFFYSFVYLLLLLFEWFHYWALLVSLFCPLNLLTIKYCVRPSSDCVHVETISGAIP